MNKTLLSLLVLLSILVSCKESSIGGVLVFNVSMGLPVGDVTYNSQEHRDILAQGAKEFLYGT